MTQIRVLRLPGGWTLPAQLVIETYVLSDAVPSERSESSALAMLEQAGDKQIRQNMIAGEILDAESAFFREDGIFRLIQSCRCREMIARFSSGIRTEGEYNDGKNGER